MSRPNPAWPHFGGCFNLALFETRTEGERAVTACRHCTIYSNMFRQLVFFELII